MKIEKLNNNAIRNAGFLMERCMLSSTHHNKGESDAE